MQQSIDYLRQKLGNHYPAGEITGFTRLIFEALCGYSPTDILLCKDTILSDDIHQQIKDITERLIRQEPIQYILGFADFCGLRFDIAPGALIPRPETAELVQLIIAENTNRPLRIADLGTGSGCIAISLAINLPCSQVEAWDFSPEALHIAQQNAHKLNAPVSFFQRDILHSRADELHQQSLVLIDSYPHYIWHSESLAWIDNVLQYEPHSALFVPNHSPLLFYEKIAEDGMRLLSSGGKLYFEINETQGNACTNMLAKLGYQEIRILKDFYEKERFAIALKP